MRDIERQEDGKREREREGGGRERVKDMQLYLYIFGFEDLRSKKKKPDFFSNIYLSKTISG